jgi:hypothetical protein
LEQETGVFAAYFTGAAGNLTAESLIPEEKHKLRWFEYGEKLGKIAADTLNDEIELTGSEIKTKRKIIKAPVDHSMDPIAETAKVIIDLYGNGRINEAIDLRKKNGIYSLIHADAVLYRNSLPESVDLELNVFRIGGVAFITTSCEMFSDQGLKIKESSPFDSSFILTGGRTYLTPDECYDYGAYEAVGYSGIYAKGTADQVANTFIEMLEAIY